MESGFVKDWMRFGRMRMAANEPVLDIASAGSNFVKENQCLAP